MRRFRRVEREQKCLNAARMVGLATHNAAGAWKCWPYFGKTRLGEQPRQWRTLLYYYVVAATCEMPEKEATSPAWIFNLSDPESKRTNLYAITGEGTIFSRESSPRFYELPSQTLMYVSGGESAEPWYAAEDVSIDTLRNSTGTIRDVLGETLSGVTFLVLRDGAVWMVDSSLPASVLARQADARDPGNNEVAPEIVAAGRRAP